MRSVVRLRGPVLLHSHLCLLCIHVRALQLGGRRPGAGALPGCSFPDRRFVRTESKLPLKVCATTSSLAGRACVRCVRRRVLSRSWDCSPFWINLIDTFIATSTGTGTAVATSARSCTATPAASSACGGHAPLPMLKPHVSCHLLHDRSDLISRHMANRLVVDDSRHCPVNQLDRARQMGRLGERLGWLGRLESNQVVV